MSPTATRDKRPAVCDKYRMPTTALPPVTTTQRRWMRAAILRDHTLPGAGDTFIAFDFAEMPRGTRDALVRKGYVLRHCIEGMGGGFTAYTLSDEGRAHRYALGLDPLPRYQQGELVTVPDACSRTEAVFHEALDATRCEVYLLPHGELATFHTHTLTR